MDNYTIHKKGVSMKIVLIGPQGSGKGTLAEKLVLKFKIPTISTGELCRNVALMNTEFGKEVKNIIESGNLLPDEIIIQMIKERLSKDDTKNGYILDGFPRNLAQAEMLEKITKPTHCLLLEVKRDIILTRLCGRLNCESCGKIYNKATFNKNTCECGGKLFVRKDDNPRSILVRLKHYEQKTLPLIDFYRRKGILKTLDGGKSPEEVFKDALKLLEN